MKAFIAVCATMLALSGPALAAEDYNVGQITISHPWARASAGMARNGAAFMTVTNKGGDDDKLVAAKADLADSTELHTHVKDGEVMRMRPVDSVAVPAGKTSELKPGGDHVMFIGLHKPLEAGQHFPLVLTFEKAGQVTVDIEVQAAGSMGQMPSHGQPMK